VTDETTVPGMGEAIETRRKSLRLQPGQFAKAAGLTPQGVDPVRKGFRRNYSEKTLIGVAIALRWPLDWYDRLIAGEDPKTWPTVIHAEAHQSLPAFKQSATGTTGTQIHVAAQNLRDHIGVVVKMFEAALDAMKDGDHASARALLRPISSTMEELVAMADELVVLDPSAEEPIDVAMAGVAESIEELASALVRISGEQSSAEDLEAWARTATSASASRQQRQEWDRAAKSGDATEPIDLDAATGHHPGGTPAEDEPI
jgi:transcriptional regulator with XRE-family HTH domain